MATLYLAAYKSAATGVTWSRANTGNGRSGFSSDNDSTWFGASGTATGPTSGSGNDSSVGVTLTGLTPGTEYKLWLIWDDGSTSSNGPISSAAFFTQPLAELAAGGSSGALSATAQSVCSAALDTTGNTGTFSGAASSPAVVAASITGDAGAFSGSAGTGTSVSLAATGGAGSFAGSASAPATVALAALGGEGAFAGSAYPLTRAELAALGLSGAFSGLASTVPMALLAATGGTGAFAGSATVPAVAALAAAGASGVFSGAAVSDGALVITREPATISGLHEPARPLPLTLSQRPRGFGRLFQEP